MYEEKDREQMNQDEREERKVNWTTPQKLEEGRSTDESRSRETEPQQNHPSGENASWRENTPYNNQFRQDRDFSGDSRKYRKVAGIGGMDKTAGLRPVLAQTDHV